MGQSQFPWLGNNNNDYFSLCLRLGFESLLGWLSLEPGSYMGILVMRDQLNLFFVKCEFRKLFFVTRDLKVLRDP